MARVVGWVAVVVGAALAGSSLLGVGAAAAPSAPMRTVQGVTVPDVRCSSLSNAQQVLQQAGLVGQQLASSNGVVLSQSPTPGQPVTTGTTIYLVMQPAGDLRVSVPDVRGRRLGKAKRVLAAHCLKGVVADPVRHGRVANQSPSPDTLTRVGTRVRLSAVAAGPRTSPSNAEHDQAPGANATPPTSGSGSIGSVAVAVLLLVVLAAAIAASWEWRRGMRPGRRLDRVSSLEPAPAGPTAAVDALPVAASAVPKPSGLSQRQADQPPTDPRFTWLARRGTTSTTIDEEGT